MFTARMSLILLAFVAFFGTSEAFASASAARIEKVGKKDQPADVKSAAKVLRAGSVISLREGDSLQIGDEINTDAQTAVDLRLEDDTLIRVGVNSSYKVQDDPKNKSLIHRLLSGVVRVLVPKSEKKDSSMKFRMYTSEGTIGVRGTEFVVMRADGATQLKGLDGEVLFGPPEQSFEQKEEFVLVGRGFSSSSKGKPGKVEKFELQKYIYEINGKDGPFGPLSERTDGSKKLARGESISAPIVSLSGKALPEKRDEKEKTVPSAKKEGKERVDYQLQLWIASSDGDLDDVKGALKGGANINRPDKDGNTALHFALESDKDKVVGFLIKNGADVDAINGDGHSPLMLVASNKLDMTYTLALVYPGGADLDLKNNKGEDATSIAKANGYKEFVEYLESKVAGEEHAKAIAEKEKEAEKAAARRKAALKEAEKKLEGRK